MKRSLTLVGVAMFLVLFVSQVFAQTTIPNAGFESWTGGNPDNWWTNNQPAPLSWLPLIQSRTARSGTSSARGEVVTITGGVAYSPLLAAGTTMGGFAWTQRSGNITGYYQFFPASGSGDRISVLASMMKGGANGAGVAVGGGYVPTAASSWTQFSVPFAYFSADVPDWASLSFIISGPGSANPRAGSYFLLDDLAFSGTASAVEDGMLPQTFALEQNYPNPFNPSTTIRFSVAQPGHVSLKVYNVLGVGVASLVDEQKEPGTFSVNWNAAGLPSGMYLYRLSATSDKGQVFDQSKKLVLLK